MDGQQLSLFQQGEDLPLFQQAQAEPEPQPPIAYRLGRKDAEQAGTPGTLEHDPNFDPEAHAHQIANTFSHPEIQIPQYIQGAKDYQAQPATPTEALAAKLHEIHGLRVILNKPPMTSKRHNFKGWSQRARPGAVDRWLRGLKYELAHRDTEKAAAIAAYEAKRQARVDRLHARADKAQAEAQSRFDTADRMASVIPMGQPILVGHYSEKADRRYRERIHTNMRKGIDAQAQAADLRRRAEAAERNRAIFTEDPQAQEKLADKIERLTQRQEMMKAANKLVRKEDRNGLAQMGFSEAVIAQLFTPDFCGRLGFPDYELKNNNANIRRLKKRLESLEHLPTENKETEHEHFTIVENADEYRIQILFDGKPPSEVRRRLKASGFRWAPSQGAWQRHLNNAGRWAAESFAQWYSEEVR